MLAQDRIATPRMFIALSGQHALPALPVRTHAAHVVAISLSSNVATLGSFCTHTHMHLAITRCNNLGLHHHARGVWC